jgi:hypothetical protein
MVGDMVGDMDVMVEDGTQITHGHQEEALIVILTENIALK